jgi:Flp pilus assembly protein TadG
MRIQNKNTRRRGAVIVESAFVLVIFLMFMFGIFEYCRYLFVMHVATNATRDAARYAVVNTDKPSTFYNTNYTDASGKTYVSIQQYTNNLMAGVDKNIAGYTVNVFPCDSSKLNQTPPVIQSKSGSPAWNNAAFTEKIAVQITGTYSPFLATFLQIPANITINVISICGSEG